ncbi:MAG: YbaK/EbsC family protein [Candidatus Bathyarchaeota archaeon]|nr:YbaK/EbsC family protein [Candidatus Bathyarchaeota archaeon]
MSNNIRGSKRVSAYLEEKGIEARVVTLDESTRTSQLAADALGCTVAEIAKSIVFKAGEQAVVVVISGDRRVDAKKVSAHLGVKVGNADADTVKALTGYAIGGVPPFPHDPAVKVILDGSLTRFERVWAAAGTPNSVMNLTVAQLRGIVGDLVDVAQ